MSEPQPTIRITIGRQLVAVVAIGFGLLTLVAGGRVLGGSDPGYVVYRPLLIYNTTMGAAYLAAGIITLRSLKRGKLAAAAVFVLNLLVFAFIGYVYVTSDSVAIESIRAMTLRTSVWLVLFLVLAFVESQIDSS